MAAVITPADDLPVHQSSRPVRDPGADRNLYDRFFFNGHNRAGDCYFAVALGQYPGRDVTDAAIAVSIENGDGRTQHNLRASRQLGANRLDTTVGPIRVEVVEPLRRLRVTADDEESGFRVEIEFTASAAPIEEGHYLRKNGHRTVFDYTRLTQPGRWSGTITVPGYDPIAIDAREWTGWRDRSWGIRPVGEQEPFGPPAGERPGFYWLWLPVQFDDRCFLFDVNETPDGEPWHAEARSIAVGGRAEDAEAGRASYEISLQPGTRHAREFSVEFELPSGRHRLLVEPLYPFFMQGIGYTHPTWGHGVWQGGPARAYDTLDVDGADLTIFPNLHIQAVSRITRSDGVSAVGILEQLIIGPHDPTGLESIIDMARASA